jgi:hypothetical protein
MKVCQAEERRFEHVLSVKNVSLCVLLARLRENQVLETNGRRKPSATDCPPLQRETSTPLQNGFFCLFYILPFIILRHNGLLLNLRVHHANCKDSSVQKRRVLPRRMWVFGEVLAQQLRPLRHLLLQGQA